MQQVFVPTFALISEVTPDLAGAVTLAPTSCGLVAAGGPAGGRCRVPPTRQVASNWFPPPTPRANTKLSNLRNRPDNLRDLALPESILMKNIYN